MANTALVYFFKNTKQIDLNLRFNTISLEHNFFMYIVGFNNRIKAAKSIRLITDCDSFS